MQTAERTATRTGTKTTGLRVLTAIILILLAVQFFIGMWVNLFVQVPDKHPGVNAPEYFSGVFQGVLWALSSAPLWLRLHASVGLLLFLASIVLLVLAIAARRGSWIAVAIVGFLGIVGAGFNGASFMNYGHDFSSLLMAVGFLLAAIPYTIGIGLRRT